MTLPPIRTYILDRSKVVVGPVLLMLQSELPTLRKQEIR